MLPTIERCWLVGIRMPLRRHKCAVWRSSATLRWNGCSEGERAAVTVQARGIEISRWRLIRALHAAENEAFEDNGECIVSASFYISAEYRGRVIIFRWASPGGRAHLNVNYRLLPWAFPSRTDQGPSRRIFGGYYGFCGPPPPAQTRRTLALPPGFCSLGRGAVFQFATSFAPLSVQSRARSALSPEPDIEVSAIDFSELFAKPLGAGGCE